MSSTQHYQGVSPVFLGILALTYPSALVVVALSIGFREGGGMGDFAGSLAAAVLFLIAAPTAWALSFPFIEVSRITVFVAGIVTSAPFWYFAGVALARRSTHWLHWVRAYAIICVAWTAANLFLFGLIASLVG